ncbi:SKI family transcriptional corepressor 1 homolog-B-like [Hemiscyllium ocellatum]|uniref:SKI family transcriptional corepressor 1 homolog-B-like n=1 Tax=Hemiscyllium ocellatum TaxID=170820 RepID=UPI002966B206|nr:SKI family transcriptional corepressor 1 homolog-B-like [Hemiscyllium ocellatum]
MEKISTQLGVINDAASTPTSKQELQPYSQRDQTASSNLKTNTIGEAVLYGLPIVSLVIDGQERLCLAQISNTLLKNYSYNEIHNRRVALGITCVQCTPVQLEILRRAGAMPISSRRCGMITKREAERLCKSFLGEHTPPKLPENFAFDVSHECAWGCRGNFIPARYNSSRAKCIKCSYCNMYFSPNKFIFHSHRVPDTKYTQPDAANFNSWRRHLKLSDKIPSEYLAHAWEDVKAMFNGGSRKRTLPNHGSGSSASLKAPGASSLPPRGSDIPHKALRCEDEGRGMNLPNNVRSYPVIPVPSKGFGMLQKMPPPIFPHPYGFPTFGLCQKKDDANVVGDKTQGGLPSMFWSSAKDTVYPSFPMFWPAAGALPVPPYPQSQPKVSETPNGRQNEMDVSEQSDRSSNTPKDSLADSERCSSTHSRNEEDPRSGDEARSVEGISLTPRKLNYISAFRPVVKDAESIAKLYGNREVYNGARPGYGSPDFMSDSSSYRSVSPEVDSEGEEPEVDVESNRCPEDEASPPLVDTVPETELVPDREVPAPPEPTQDISTRESRGSPFGVQGSEKVREGEASGEQKGHEVFPHDREGHLNSVKNACSATPAPIYTETAAEQDQETQSTAEDPEPRKSYQQQGGVSQETSANSERGEDGIRLETPRTQLVEKDIENMGKEELQKLLLEQMELRKKLEREFQSLKDSFQDQMKRELAYREEMVQQLQIVRDTLCNELDQERKARYAIQQKLKEAHDALHHFSCKMLTPRHCTGNCSFKPPLLPQ